MHILLATDVDWIVDEITAALGGPDTSFTVCREGRVVVGVVAEREPDLAILDMQIGSKGGMAVTMALRLDESAGMLPHVPVIMLLDRRADVFLARRSGADGLADQAPRPAADQARRRRRHGRWHLRRGRPGARRAGGRRQAELTSPAIETEDELASPTIETGEPAPAG